MRKTYDNDTFSKRDRKLGDYLAYAIKSSILRVADVADDNRVTAVVLSDLLVDLIRRHTVEDRKLILERFCTACLEE